MKVRLFHGSGAPVLAGPGEPTLLMALMGMSHGRDYSAQLEKIDALVEMEERADVIADLSIVQSERPLWARVVEHGCAAATLPIYTVGASNNRIDAAELLDRAIEQMEGGVGLITIHPTASIDLVNAAKRRIVPWTSRGGGRVIADLLASGRKENVYAEIMEDLVAAAARYNAVLSIGATFRSANIFDSMDEVQQSEIEAQLTLAGQITKQGVGVIIESPGHARPRDIIACSRTLAQSGYPIMPLGPIPTDAAVGMDHVSAAIGATIMGMAGAAHILAAVTREEHTGGIPTLASTIEAVRAARVAAHVIDVHQLSKTERDAEIVGLRARHRTCVAGKKGSGCSRCGKMCPLTTDPG